VKTEVVDIKIEQPSIPLPLAAGPVAAAAAAAGPRFWYFLSYHYTHKSGDDDWAVVWGYGNCEASFPSGIPSMALIHQAGDSIKPSIMRRYPHFKRERLEVAILFWHFLRQE